MKNASYKSTFLSIITLSTLCFVGSAFAKQVTVVVAPKSIEAGEDGFSFKSKDGKDYYVYHNGDRIVKGVEFISKKNSTVCLTIDTANADDITAISNGECKSTQTNKTPPVPKQVIKAASGYANSIACYNSKIEPKDVITLVPHSNSEDVTDAKYAVLWNADISCNFGTGDKGGTNISIVTVNGNEIYVVDPLQSSPVIEFQSPVQYVSKIISNTKNAIVLEGNEAAETDPNCCPSIPIRFTLTSDAKGNWKMTDRKVLPTK